MGTINEAIVIHTVAETAEILRVKESWLERQAAARKIPFTMLGGAYRFTSGHIAAIIRIHEKTPCADDEAKDCDGTRPPRARERGTREAVTVLRPRPRTGPRRAA